jgi:hypothetical protein
MNQIRLQDIVFIRAMSREERQAANLFLARHNARGQGSTRGYVAYYAAVDARDPGLPLIECLVAVAKICPCHTPQAARFFAGEDWKHVYVLQRLAAHRAPANLLSKFLAWCLKQCAKDQRIHYLATYADSGSVDPRNGRCHDGGIYRAAGATYCGATEGGRVEGFLLNGRRRSVRCGPKTYTVSELRAMNEQARLENRPEPVRLLRARPMRRYCWAIGETRSERRRRRRLLERRMHKYRFEPWEQPRLLARMKAWLRLRWLTARPAGLTESGQ